MLHSRLWWHWRMCVIICLWENENMLKQWHMLLCIVGQMGDCMKACQNVLEQQSKWKSSSTRHLLHGKKKIAHRACSRNKASTWFEGRWKRSVRRWSLWKHSWVLPRKIISCLANEMKSFTTPRLAKTSVDCKWTAAKNRSTNTTAAPPERSAPGGLWVAVLSGRNPVSH